MNKIPYARQEITETDIQEVVLALKSEFITQGPIVNNFENEFSNYVGSKYAVAVSNGTAALHLCTIALGLESGKKVITTPITFSASANCIRYCQGEVKFADIDPQTYLIDINSVKKILEESPKGTYSGIIPVDFAGRAVNMEELKSLADKWNLWIIEDSCHSPGGYFKKKDGGYSKCGSGEFADLAIFSFHPAKHIAAGEGGMITTNNKTLYKKLLNLRSHGIVKDGSFENSTDFATGIFNSKNYPNWYMEMQTLGYNYRLSDIQSALGLSQLKRATQNLYKRKEIAKRYFKVFKNCNYILGQSAYVDGHAYHLYVIEVQKRLELYEFLRSFKIYTQIHYIPVHLMPYYRSLGSKVGDNPHSEKYYKNCISLPMFPSLSKNEQDFVINKIIEFHE